MASSSINRSDVWTLISALFFSLVLPYFFMYIDKNSKCSLISLIDVDTNVIFVLSIAYFGVPILAAIYGLYRLSASTKKSVHDTENSSEISEKPKLFYALIILNFLSPIMLIFWIILFRFGSTCYELHLHPGF